MKAVEFESRLTAEGALSVPPTVIDAIPADKRLRVLVLIADGDDEKAWEDLAASDFGRGYGDGDAIYDQLSTG